jgi:hypothetical protein
LKVLVDTSVWLWTLRRRQLAQEGTVVGELRRLISYFGAALLPASPIHTTSGAANNFHPLPLAGEGRGEGCQDISSIYKRTRLKEAASTATCFSPSRYVGVAAVKDDVEPRALVQADKRNVEHFPEDFMFQLSA